MPSARKTSTSRTVQAGCHVCHGTEARWLGGQAQGTAARHHDLTNHPTWCDVVMKVRYGRATVDDRQIDLEDSIAASLGGEPEAAPLPDLDTPTTPVAGVSAPKAAQSKQRARGRKPEPACA